MFLLIINNFLITVSPGGVRIGLWRTPGDRAAGEG